MFRVLFSTLSILAIVCPAHGAPPGDVFPMSTGTYWVYRGEVEWEENKERKSAAVELKMEVVETISRQDGVVAVLKGYPTDVMQPLGRERSDHLLISIGETKYYLLSGSDVTGALQSIKNADQHLSELVDASHLILQFPLKPGTVFGEPDQLKRGDNMYVWWVEHTSLVRLTDVQGAPAGQQTKYSITFLTNPDHTYVTFVPGVGITSFMYGHHGTVSECRVDLVELHLPPK